MPNNYRNILIIKPSAMGDIVHALPVLESLRAAVPDARISWLVRREFAPLLACVEGVDEIVLFDREGLARWYYKPSAFKALLQFIRTLKQGRYDLVLDLQGLLRTGLFAWMTGCRRRIGMADCREMAGLFYTQKVPRPATSLHVLDYYHTLLSAAGIDANPAHEVFFKIPDDAAASIRQKLKKGGVQNSYCVLIPSSAQSDKCWPAERFARMGEALHNQYNLSIVLVGTQRDRAIIKAIKSHSRIGVIDMVNKTTIFELIALLQNSAGVVSNDTGPGHIAAAMHVPTVLIFGHTNPMRVGPYGCPECVAAVDPDQRSKRIESPDPAHRIEHVSFEQVWEKITTQLNTAQHKKK